MSMERFVKACEKSRKNQLHIIEAMENEPEFKESLKRSLHLSDDTMNPVLKAYKKELNSGAFGRTYFHNCSPSDIGKITLYKVWSESEEDPMVALAHAVFGSDDEHIAQINCVISHFDELLPPICKRGKIPAYYLFVFMEWCGNITSIDSFLDYFQKYYLSHGGKWKVIGVSSITGAKNRPLKQQNRKDEYDEIKSDMQKAITAILKKETDIQQ